MSKHCLSFSDKAEIFWTIFQKSLKYKDSKFSITAPAPGGQANWGKTLDADKAGAADNAADFTKQFMAQMYGGGKQDKVLISIESGFLSKEYKRMYFAFLLEPKFASYP